MLNQSFTFGVEIEFVGASTYAAEEALREAGMNCNAESYNHTTQRHWKVVTDASLGRSNAGELVSPVLSGESGLAELKKAMDALATIPGIHINRNCGIHVHLAWDGMTTAQVITVVQRYSKYEGAIDAWMPASRRGHENRWCKSMPARTVSAIARANSLSSIAYAQGDKYFKVNTMALNRYGTIEFRHHSGTLEFAKVENWVRFLVGFTEASCKLTGCASTYRAANKNRVFPAIREQVENAGGTMVYRRNKSWDLTCPSGVTTNYTVAELDALYTEGRPGHVPLDPVRFAEFWGKHFDAAAADTLFAGVPAASVDFLTNRTAHFAAAA
jgi:hypothetical protein